MRPHTSPPSLPQWRVFVIFRNARVRSSYVCGCIAALIGCLALSACGTVVQVATDKVAEIALSAVGVKMPQNPNAPQPPKIIKLHLEGATDLNAGQDGQGLSTVVQIYKLRDQTGFLSLPYASFGSPELEKAGIGSDLVNVRELTLAPGQILDLQEKMENDAAYLGVVTLFRSPYPRRWRFAFATAQAEQSRITIGVYACAMTATDVAPTGMTLGESALLSNVKCQ